MSNLEKALDKALDNLGKNVIKSVNKEAIKKYTADIDFVKNLYSQGGFIKLVPIIKVSLNSDFNVYSYRLENGTMKLYNMNLTDEALDYIFNNFELELKDGVLSTQEKKEVAEVVEKTEPLYLVVLENDSVIQIKEVNNATEKILNNEIKKIGIKGNVFKGYKKTLENINLDNETCYYEIPMVHIFNKKIVQSPMFKEVELEYFYHVFLFENLEEATEYLDDNYYIDNFVNEHTDIDPVNYDLYKIAPVDNSIKTKKEYDNFLDTNKAFYIVGSKKDDSLVLITEDETIEVYKRVNNYICRTGFRVNRDFCQLRNKFENTESNYFFVDIYTEFFIDKHLELLNKDNIRAIATHENELHISFKGSNSCCVISNKYTIKGIDKFYSYYHSQYPEPIRINLEEIESVESKIIGGKNYYSSKYSHDKIKFIGCDIIFDTKFTIGIMKNEIEKLYIKHLDKQITKEIVMQTTTTNTTQEGILYIKDTFNPTQDRLKDLINTVQRYKHEGKIDDLETDLEKTEFKGLLKSEFSFLDQFEKKDYLYLESLYIEYEVQALKSIVIGSIPTIEEMEEITAEEVAEVVIEEETAEEIAEEVAEMVIKEHISDLTADTSAEVIETHDFNNKYIVKLYTSKDRKKIYSNGVFKIHAYETIGDKQYAICIGADGTSYKYNLENLGKPKTHKGGKGSISVNLAVASLPTLEDLTKYQDQLKEAI